MAKKAVCVPSEAQEQQRVVEYLEWKGICYVHTPNEGKRNPVTGNILKRMGMKKGFPDLFIYEPVGCYHGLAIEMKSKKGRPTDEQKKWIARLNERGYAAYIAYGADEAIRIIESYDKEGT